MKIAFPIESYINSSKPPLYTEIIKYLQKKYETEIVIVTYGKGAQKYVKRMEKKIRINRTYDIVDYINNYLKINKSEENICEIEKKYGIPNLALYTVAGYELLKGDNRERKINKVVAIIKFWENFFDLEKIDCYIDEGIVGLNLPILKIAKIKATKVFNLFSARVPNRFVIIHNHQDKWEDVEEKYIELKNRPLTDKEKQEAEQYLEKFYNKELKPDYVVYTMSEGIFLSTFYNFLRYIYHYYILERGKNIFIKPPLDKIKERIVHYLRKIIIHTFYKWDSVKKDEKYFYFPLHYQPEASTLVLAPYYVNQIELIKNIAKSLPSTHVLYVKEHPASIGTRNVSYYKELRKIPGVKLISPFVDSYELIKNSDAVITITGTAGFESILFEKPVVVFGNVFYKFAPNCYFIYDITKLANILLEISANKKKYSRELTLKFVSAFLQGSLIGEMATNLPWVINSDNISKLAEGIYKKLSQLTKH